MRRLGRRARPPDLHMPSFAFRSFSAILIASAIGLAFASRCRAATIVPDVTSVGQTSYTVDGITFQASGGTFTYASKCPGCMPGLGISGDPVGDEIDPHEMMTIILAEPRVITGLVIGYLYPAGTFGSTIDAVDEGVVIQTTDGSTITFVATGPTTASLTGSGSWSSIQAAQNGSGGAWRITTPFGGVFVSSLQVRPLINTSDCDPAISSAKVTTACSDFTLNEIDLSDVAEPNSALLVGTGAFALGLHACAFVLFYRRSRSSEFRSQRPSVAAAS